VQQHYFGVPSLKIASESADHFDACDKLAVEGFKSIRNTACGSGAGRGHSLVGSGTADGVEAQPLRAIKISANSGITCRLAAREPVGILGGLCGMGRLLRAVGALLCKGLCDGVGNGLGVLLAYLRQFRLGIADARLLHATGQQSTGHGAGGGEYPPGDEIDGHTCHTFSIGVRPANAISTRLGADLRSLG